MKIKVTTLKGIIMNENFGIEIIKQGRPVLSCNIPNIYQNDNKFIIGSMDLRQKHCFIESTFSKAGGNLAPEFGFSVAASVATDEIEKWGDSIYEHNTEIAFTGLDKDWGIYLIDCSRYTISFVLWNTNNITTLK